MHGIRNVLTLVLGAVALGLPVAAQEPQAGHGTGSRRRTMPTTRSPAPNPVPGGACTTRPSDSCPMISRSCPGGAAPYSPLMISRSVPQMPIAWVWTRIGPSPAGGSGMSASATEACWPGMTVTACIAKP